MRKRFALFGCLALMTLGLVSAQSVFACPCSKGECSKGECSKGECACCGDKNCGEHSCKKDGESCSKHKSEKCHAKEAVDKKEPKVRARTHAD